MAAISNLLLTGGFFHRFDETGPYLAGVLEPAGVESEITEDLDAGLARLAGDATYDLVTVYALRWRMLHPMFDGARERWAFTLSESGREALRGHLARGGGLLAVHTAAICFDDWPEWGEIVGAAWNWERSTHPPPRTLEIDVRTGAHPIVAGVERFAIEDELYSFLDWQPDAEALMTCRYRGEDQALLAARPREAGRVVYDALGHDIASLSQPAHQTILRRSARWAAGAPDARVEETV